jgi:hypothetical protein
LPRSRNNKVIAAIKERQRQDRIDKAIAAQEALHTVAGYFERGFDRFVSEERAAAYRESDKGQVKRSAKGLDFARCKSHETKGPGYADGSLMGTRKAGGTEGYKGLRDSGLIPLHAELRHLTERRVWQYDAKRGKATWNRNVVTYVKQDAKVVARILSDSDVKRPNPVKAKAKTEYDITRDEHRKGRNPATERRSFGRVDNGIRRLASLHGIEPAEG